MRYKIITIGCKPSKRSFFSSMDNCLKKPLKIKSHKINKIKTNSSMVRIQIVILKIENKSCSFLKLNYPKINLLLTFITKISR